MKRFAIRSLPAILFVLAGLLLIHASSALSQTCDPALGRRLEQALADAENFRKQMQGAQYDATVRVQEWNGRGELRGTARATMVVRPGDAHPYTFTSREVHGKVRLPDDDDRSDDKDDNTTLQEFSRNHAIAERFNWVAGAADEVAGERATRVDFSPNYTQPEKNTGDRFLNSLSGAVWLNERTNRLVKFDLRLVEPFQLFWIFAVLREFSIHYELIKPGEILGHARLNIVFSVYTPIHSLRQDHDWDLDHFRRRNVTTASVSESLAVVPLESRQ